MAIRNSSNINKPTVTGQVPPGFKGILTFRIKNAKYGPSSSGLPMITLDTEIVVPTSVKSDIDGKDYDLTGLKVPWWLMLNDKTKDGKDSENLDYFVNTLLPLLGLPAEIDDEAPLMSEQNPNGLKLEGICFDALVSTQERIEQRRLPNGQYVPVINPATGKELSRGWEWNKQTKDILRKVDATA